MKKPSRLDRFRAKKAQRPAIAVGVAWYTPAEWARVKAVAADPELFENSFAEWEAMANEAFATVRAAVPNPVKVLIAADELLAWCLAHGKTNNSASRAEFVSEKLRRNDDKSA